MNKYRIFQVDSFTGEKFRGNPAGVVLNADGLTDSEMQGIARELNNSETAFILSPDADDHDLWIRFFTPTVEVPSCGHATIAAHYVNAVENNLSSCKLMQKIGIGILPVEIKKIDKNYKIYMTQGEIEFSKTFQGDQLKILMSAFRITETDINKNCPVQIVSTGHSKVIVGIKSKKVLNSLNPDLAVLKELSKKINCNGYFVFTFDSDNPDILTHGRMFAPAIGIPEDPVTGNANGPLGAYLVHNKLVDFKKNDTFMFNSQQGEAINRAGIVEVIVEIIESKPVRVKIGGNAVIVFQTEIKI